MPSIFIIKSKIENPTEWYDRKFANDIEWEEDEFLESYHAGDIYISVKDEMVSVEDMSELTFLDWDTEAWINLAEGRELMYGYYSEEQLEAEFVHVKDGRCIRNYREYAGEIEADEGDEPHFENWVDVSMYVDEKMLNL